MSQKLLRYAMGVAAVAVGAAMLAPASASAARIQAQPEVPAAIQPPAGSVKVATFRVKIGFQIYRCTDGAWSLKAPSAMIRHSEDDRRTIYHYGGPTWQSMTDGSLVTAVKKAEASVPGTIPLLLLEVSTHGGTANGELSTISHIQRVNTRGGVAPSGPCVDGAEQPVQYGADYVFFKPADSV